MNTYEYASDAYANAQFMYIWC